MIDRSKIKIIIILLILGLIGGLGGAFVSLRPHLTARARPSLSDDFAVRQIAHSYLQAWQDADPEKMYVFLSNTDKYHVSMPEYKRHFEAFPVSPVHFKVSTVRLVDPTRAVIRVRIAWPEPDEERFIERDEQLVLVKEESVWRIREEESLN